MLTASGRARWTAAFLPAGSAAESLTLTTASGTTIFEEDGYVGREDEWPHGAFR